MWNETERIFVNTFQNMASPTSSNSKQSRSRSQSQSLTDDNKSLYEVPSISNDRLDGLEEVPSISNDNTNIMITPIDCEGAKQFVTKALEFNDPIPRRFIKQHVETHRYENKHISELLQLARKYHQPFNNSINATKSQVIEHLLKHNIYLPYEPNDRVLSLLASDYCSTALRKTARKYGVKYVEHDTLYTCKILDQVLQDPPIFIPAPYNVKICMTPEYSSNRVVRAKTLVFPFSTLKSPTEYSMGLKEIDTKPLILICKYFNFHIDELYPQFNDIQNMLNRLIAANSTIYLIWNEAPRPDTQPTPTQPVKKSVKKICVIM